MATFRGGPIKWDNVERAVTSPTHRVVSDVYELARANVARHNRTGSLLASVKRRLAHLGGQVLIGTNHWRFIEYGTHAHDIQPRRKRALFWPGAQHPVRRVRHPGNDEYAPMRRALHARARR